ncbi:MAG: hypothetical protein KAY32_06830 [Candidatus Eisenbacteria sp.]|nr:hypothetical protein [Candidatus Eisenbacteria bacterium]
MPQERFRALDDFRVRAVLVCGFLGLVSALTFDPKLYVSGDNVEYILLGQRVLREGVLWGSRKFPPFFPLLLSPIQAFWGIAWVPQKIFVSLLYVATGPLFLRMAERVLPRRLALPVTALALISIPVLEFSHYVMSEVPYLLLFTAALVAGERLFRVPGGQVSCASARTRTGSPAASPVAPPSALPTSPQSAASRSTTRTALLLFFLFSGCAFYTRSVGLVLSAALVSLALLERRWRFALAGVGLTGVVLIPWIFHTYFSGLGGETYLTQVLRINPYYPEEGLLTPAALFDRVAHNAARYFTVEIPRLLAPLAFESTYLPRPEVHIAWPAYLWGLPLLLLLAGVLRGMVRLPLTTTALLLSLLVCLLWPPIWTSVRFIIPLVPLLILFFLAGIHASMGWIGPLRRWAGLATTVFLVLLLALGGRNLHLYDQETREYPRPWAYYFEAAQWAGDHLPTGSLVVDRKAAMFTLVSGLPAISFPREEDPDRMVAHFRERGVRFVHASSIPYDDLPRFLFPTIRQRPEYFAPHWRTEQVSGMMSAILEFDPAGRGVGLPEHIRRERLEDKAAGRGPPNGTTGSRAAGP